MKAKFFESPYFFAASVSLFLALTAGSCSPKFYKVDQQTVLEDEAAGEWPEFEKEILGKSQASVPTPFPTVAASGRKARLFNVPNTVATEPLAGAKADGITESKAAPATPGKVQ